MMTNSKKNATHIPVLLDEMMRFLAPEQNDNVIDGTIGSGGHACALLQAIRPHGRLLGIDWDEKAIQRLKKQGEKNEALRESAILVHGNYRDIKNIVETYQLKNVRRILLDLGMSSVQLEDNTRGFGMKTDGWLDMRFDASERSPVTVRAWDIVNRWPEKELVRIFREYGEEPLSKEISQCIIEKRKLRTLDTPSMLVRVVTEVYNQAPFKFTLLARGKHPAQRIFQSLRIAVNDELENLSVFLPSAVEILERRGRIAIITFHSLEDRIVKNFFKKESRDCLCPKDVPVCSCGHKASLRLVTKKPLIPTSQEVTQNPRARSAKLRVAEKIL